MMRRYSAWLIVFMLISVPFAAAQHATTGSIAGRVTDASEAPVAGATVSVFSERGSRIAITDNDGQYLAPYLTPGSYSVRVAIDGYQTVERHGVDVRLGRRLDLDFELESGTFTATLEVTADAPVIDFSTAAFGLDVESDFLGQVPVGRRLSDTLYLAPGVSDSGGPGAENPSISGGSGLENQYVVDGVNITDQRYGALGPPAESST
jgi:hypothetical protein